MSEDSPSSLQISIVIHKLFPRVSLSLETVSIIVTESNDNDIIIFQGFSIVFKIWKI